MLDLLEGKLSDREINAKYHFVEVNGAIEIPTFLRIDSNEAVERLSGFGVRVKYHYGDLYAAQVPLNRFIELVQSGLCRLIDVGNLAKPNLDNARAATGVDNIYSNSDLGQRFDGTGVVVGIIDVGFEYGHPAFYDSTGTTLRIKRVWDQGATTGTAPSAFGYGAELTTSTAILAAQHSADGTSETHGTHVAGIVAGCGGNDDVGRTYRGVAPNADIVLVAFKNEADLLTLSTRVFDGIEYIKAYAESVHKQCVINMSLGHHVGPHDGTSVFDAGCDLMTSSSSGLLLVGSAGNEGSDNIHISKTFSTTDNNLYSYLDSAGSPRFVNSRTIDIWGSPNESFEARVFVYNTASNTPIVSTAMYSSANNDEATMTHTLDNGETMLIKVYCSGTTENGRQNILFEVNHPGQASSSQRMCVHISCSSNNTVHAWLGDLYGHDMSFIAAGQSYATEGDNNYTISEIGGTSNSVIAVGSYNTKNSWTALNGNHTHYSQYNTDSISGFSSHGPTLDNRTKPDITAPGCFVAAPINRYDLNYYYPPRINDRVASTVFHGVIEYYGTMSGTSMAAPHVTGILALCLQANPTLTYSQAVELLRNTAITDGHTGDIGSNGNNRWGWGKVNATGMIEELCTVTPPYIEDFEENTLCWMMDGTGSNKWVIGSTTSNPPGSGNALYISNNGGTNDGYTITSTSSVMAYRPMQLQAGTYTVSFDWKANGEPNYDYLRAALIPASTPIDNVEFWSATALPTGFIAVDGGSQLVGNLYWTTQTTTITIPSDGRYNLVFYWRNNGSGGNNPAAAIDNIHFDLAHTPDTLTVSACGSYTWNGVTYTESGVYTYSNTDNSGTAHVYTLLLTINNPTNTATEVSASGTYHWNGTSYFFSGDYTYSHPDANGCTQVDTLHLTISNQQNNVLEYWFDQNYDNRVATTLNTTGHLQIDVDALEMGPHTLYMHLRDNEGHCSPARTATFFKTFDGNAGYAYWFDNDYASGQVLQFTEGDTLLDVSLLRDGLHTLNIQTGNGKTTDLHCYIFYKMPYVGASGFNYTCWFDQNYGNRHSGSITGGAMLLDAGNLTVGLHTLNMQIGSGASAQLHSQFFYYATRTAALADTSTLLYSYAIDGQTRPTLPVSPQNRLIHLDLDVANIGAGLHSLYGWLSTADGIAMSQHSAWFYAQPEGGIGISRYEYWFNDDYDNRTEVDVTPVVDSLRLITLLQVDTLPINSNNFQFDPNGGTPIIYSRNSISFRFWNSLMRWSSVTRQYVDQRVVETVLADTIERNTTKTIVTPGTGQIHWFKLAAGPGDSLSFRTNRRGTMQLYAPSGAMILHASADSVLTWNSCRVWENGVYYMAVHDVEGGGNTDVSYLYYINQSCLSTATVAACESYIWNGNTYTESGTYIYRTIGDGGCDSVAILYLTINTPVHTATTEVACDSYTWNGSTYTTDGSYTYSHPDANGCTQVDTLHLTINHSTAVTIYDTADATYTWHGTTYTTSGTYQWHSTNSVGCDSIETLILVIIPVGIDVPDDNENTVEIYPNPTTGLLTICANGVTLVEVIDNAGRLVATYENTDHIDLGGLPAGSYMLKIHLPGRTSIHRVILE